MKIKKEQQVFNFGATSEFAKKILKRASEKLNPVKIDGAVSEHAKSYLSTFSSWATSQIISDELKKYQLPLPTGHQSSCPDAAGLKATEIQNGLFDKALQQAVLELREEELAQTNFAEETNTNTGQGGFFRDSNGNLNPVNIGLLGAGTAMLGRALTRKKKKKDDDLAFDLAVAGGLGYLGGHGGAMLLNGGSKKANNSKDSSKETQDTESSTGDSTGSSDSNTKGKESTVSTKNSTPTEKESLPSWYEDDGSEVSYVSEAEYNRLSGAPKRKLDKWLSEHGKNISHFGGRIPVPSKYISDFSRLPGLPYPYFVDSDGNFHVQRVNGKTSVYNPRKIEEAISSVTNADSGERLENIKYLKEYFGDNFDPQNADMQQIYNTLGAQWLAIHDDETEFSPNTFQHGIPWNLGWNTFQVNGLGNLRFSRRDDLNDRVKEIHALYTTGTKR